MQHIAFTNFLAYLAFASLSFNFSAGPVKNTPCCQRPNTKISDKIFSCPRSSIPDLGQSVSEGYQQYQTISWVKPMNLPSFVSVK